MKFRKMIKVTEMFKFAAAASISTISHSGTETGTLDEVQKWMDKVQIKTACKVLFLSKGK